MHRPAETLLELWTNRLEDQPDDVVLTCAGRSWTCAEADRYARSVAAGLQGRGIAPGDRVMLQLPNVPEFMPLVLGIAYAGAVQLPINTEHRGVVLEHVMTEARPRWFITGEGGVDHAVRAREVLPDLLGSSVLGGERAATALPDGVASMDALLGDPETAEPHRATPATPLSVLYTSGTTGPPKGSVLPHGYYAFMARDALHHTRGDADSVYFSPLPLAHIAAQGFVFLPGLLSGGRVVIEESFSASRFWEQVADHQVTHFHWLGAMLSMLARHPGERMDPGRGTVVGFGAAMPTAVRGTFEERFGVKLLECFGLSEIGVACWTPWEGNKPGSFGTATGGYDVVVADADDRPVPSGAVGEILMRPREPNIMFAEYLNRPEDTARAFRNLWFHTGDLGRIDADGFGTFVDRAKDAVRSRGNNISSWEVEQAVLQHEDVMEAAAFGVPSDLGEEDLYVVVVPRPGGSPSATELFDFCIQHMARHAVPRYIEVTAAVPRTETGKIRKADLRRRGVVDDAWDRQALGIALPRKGSPVVQP